MTGERSPRAALALVVAVTVVLSVALSLVHLPSAVLFASLIGGMAHALTSPTPLSCPRASTGSPRASSASSSAPS